MNKKDFSEESSFEDLIDRCRTKVRFVMDEHFKAVDHDKQRKELEMNLILENLKFLRNKWTAEILWELEINGAMIFNELMRRLGKISSRLLSDRLKDLKKYKLITRNVQDTSPPSVLYELNDKGKGFIELTMILIWYMVGAKDMDF